jgi:hypothetical protein
MRSDFRKLPTFALDLYLARKLTELEWRVYVAIIRHARFNQTPRQLECGSAYIASVIGSDRSNVHKALKGLSRHSAERPALLVYRRGANQHAPSVIEVIETATEEKCAVVPRNHTSVEAATTATPARPTTPSTTAPTTAHHDLAAETCALEGRGLEGLENSPSASSLEEGGDGIAEGDPPPVSEERLRANAQAARELREELERGISRARFLHAQGRKEEEVFTS